MTTELVTAHAGKNHVGSEDVGALYAGALGRGRFAFDVGERLAVTMTDANTVRIGTGVFLMDGRQVRVKEAESVKVANGSQGTFRRDLVTYTYQRDPSNGNVEEGTWSVLQGTAAANEDEAKAPGYAAGNILEGDLTATVAVAEVSLSGLTPTAKLLLPSVASLKTLGESVSQVIQRATTAGGSKLTLAFKSANHATALVLIDNNGSVSLMLVNCYNKSKKTLGGIDLSVAFPTSTIATISSVSWSEAVVITPSGCTITTS